MYTLSVREGEGEVGGRVGDGGWMSYGICAGCAGKLPVLPRCYSCKKDLRP